EFAKDLYARTKQFGASRGSTAFATFLAAFKILLFRLTAQEDVVVGIGTAGQSIIGIDFLVGHCVNTLPLRNRIHPDQPFTDFLKSVNRSFLEGYEHQNYTFGTLLQKLNLGRDPSQTPLISVMYNMDQELKGLSFGQLDFELYPDPNPYVNFDLSFNLCEKQGGLILECEYNRDLLDATTIRRWLGHYQSLLEEILSDPDQPISALSVLSTTQREQLLLEWNHTDQPYPRDQCVHEIFEAQASRSPDAIAVVFEGKELTYGELNRRANLLAHYLRALGVGPDVLVGICLERSLEMVIALLATLKAGGAYVPLDPAYPKERLSFMIRDAKVEVLLTQQRWIKLLPEHETRAFCLDPNWERLVKKKIENPVSATTPENLAYVIYTSGSTGRPKGVEVPHRGITRLLFGVDYAQLDSTQTFCHMAPISFDAATFELWGALLYGAKCVLYPGTFPTPAELKAVLQQHKVSVLWLTASLFNTVIDEAPEGLSKVRQLLIGGEPLSVKHVRRALDLLPETQIVNCYGPTESTTFACSYPIPRQLEESLRSVPIGRPISNTRAYILDARLERVPVGIPGELYIGGDGLARGYLNRPELTAQKFIRNPFSSNPSSRLYKTGDLARYLPNGNVEFVGRMDNQVKVRGFRIELGEIENILGRHPGVKKAVVLAREDNPGDKRLVGYIVPQRQLDLSTDGLRSYLKDRLPDYMVPSAFVFLDDLPLTPNGKIDRKTLPIPDQNRSRLVGSYQSPRTTMEEALARIWSEVLGVEKVGINDNFFDLGGHSLLAVRAVNLIKKRIGQTIRIADIFQASTVERMASFLHDDEVATPCSSLVPLQTEGSKPVFFWVHGDASSAYLPRYLDPEQRLYGLQHQSTDGQPAVYRSVEDIATHYLEEIYTVQPHGPYRLGGNCFGGLVAFEMAHQLQKRGESVDLLALLNPASPRTRASKVRYSPISTLVNELPHFLQVLLSFRLSGRSNDALKKVKGSISAAIRKPLRSVKKAAQKAICTICERFSLSIPVSLRSRYILEIYFQALQFYVLRPFQGDMVLFLSQDFPRERRVYWSKQSTGIVTIHDVPGDHTGVLEDENVKVWAEKLASCLEAVELEQPEVEKAVRALALH
ncbi:MAG: amino acid adenylation domain-containing protein, partial [Candidatus Binatia bacterium]